MKQISPEEVAERLSELSWKGDRCIPFDWNRQELLESRRHIRAQIFIDRGGYDKAKSDFGRPGAAHYHELINRHRTPEGSVLRWLAYQPELCALLTVEEHANAHNTEVRNELFQIKYIQYGFEDVKLVFDLISEISLVSLGIDLPAPQEAK